LPGDFLGEDERLEAVELGFFGVHGRVSSSMVSEIGVNV